MAQSNRGYTSSVKKTSRPWLLLAYRIPREPSTPRISVWRKLRQLGTAQIVDGLVTLPADNRTREHFGWLAEEIREASGEAWIWESAMASESQERDLVAAMSTDVATEYAAIALEARKVEKLEVTPARAIARLRRELHRVEAKDYFASTARRKASAAIERLAKTAKTPGTIPQ